MTLVLTGTIKEIRMQILSLCAYYGAEEKLSSAAENELRITRR